VTFDVPPSQGTTKYMQFFVKNPTGSLPAFSSTDAFTITY